MLKKLLAQICTGGSILLLSATPILAADITVDISGNGTGSKNTSNIDLSCTETVSQNNNSLIGNDVTVTTETGNVQANANTGGDVTVTTGDATTVVTITNNGSSNSLSGSCCCTTTALTMDVTIGPNGSNTVNKSTVDQTKTSTKLQKNKSTKGTLLVATTSTKKVKANGNTAGAVTVNTGIGSTTVGLTNSGDSNIVIP